MIIKNRFVTVLFSLVICAGFVLPVTSASAAEGKFTVKSDVDTARELGLLQADGNSVNADFLAKKSTRLQAAITSLLLQGYLEEALSYKGNGNFKDAALVDTENQAILSYLKNHPERGWAGTTGNMFDPLAEISAQQFYKVLLEVLGYEVGKDFNYADTLSFAASKGLMQIANAATLTNTDIATALVEGLSATSARNNTLFSELQERKVLPADAKLPSGERITLRSDAKLGTYFADKTGRTLYFFTKDAENTNACQGKCIENWPLFYSEDLQIPAELNAADFSVLTRTNGTKQLTYKGWPLYYFAKDMAGGDIKGEAFEGVWFVAKPDYTVMLGTSSKLGNYLTDDHGRTLYYFDKDVPQTSTCEGKCIDNWPAYMATGNSVPTGIASSDFSTITRSDSRKQLTYKGYPLYYFAKDQEHGATSGHDFNQLWFVIDPAKFDGTTAAKASGAPAAPGSSNL
ncbi:hypothetical protein ABES58_13030 [Paenibacillus lautus]|uniref:hypothetical protein n=1 Tax=Paenibacillus lautus TaxID=1401 RepID=UPI003D2D074F